MTDGERTALSVVLAVGAVWVDFFLASVLLPERWSSAWYSLPLIYTFILFVVGAGALPQWKRLRKYFD